MVVRKSTMGTVEDGTKVFSLEVYFPVVCTVLMLGSIQVFHQGDIGFKCWYRYTMNNLDDDRFDAQSLHHKLKPTAEYSKVWVFVMSDGAQKRVQGVDPGWDYSWTAILSIEVQLILRLTSLCQSHYYLMVSVCMYDTSGWVVNPYPARSASCL